MDFLLVLIVNLKFVSVHDTLGTIPHSFFRVIEVILKQAKRKKEKSRHYRLGIYDLPNL